MRGSAHDKCVRRIESGSNLMLLELDVAEAFPTDVTMNQALRAVLNKASEVPKSKRLPNTPAEAIACHAPCETRVAPAGPRMMLGVDG